MENSTQAIEAYEGTMSAEVKDDFTGLYDIRDYTLDDKNFVMASFLRGLYYGDSWFSQVPKDLFMDSYKHIIDGFLNTCIVSVACLPEDPKIIIGYSIISRDCEAIVWVYVKKRWRRKGVGKHLVPLHPAAVTHLSKLGKDLLEKLNGAVFNPFYRL